MLGWKAEACICVRVCVCVCVCVLTAYPVLWSTGPLHHNASTLEISAMFIPNGILALIQIQGREEGREGRREE